MKFRYRSKTVAILLAAMASGSGCGNNPVTPPDPTVLQVIVRSSMDSTSVVNSNVVLYRAETGEAVVRGMTDVRGIVTFTCAWGDYYVNISAQGFETVPPENIAATPFFVAPEDTTSHAIFLDEFEGSENSGFIFGSTDPAINNVLLLASSQTTGQKHATVSGPDGVFVIYNLPFDTYALNALKSGHRMTEPADAILSSVAPVDTVRIGVAEYSGSSLSGSVTFLASENSIVDITLLDPDTQSVIPGLTVVSNASGLTYSMTGIPDGDFLAWASLRNDGYVIDPDWVFKNPNGLNVSFTNAISTELNFSVTDAITLLSPTNPASSTFPAIATSAVPIFTWKAYPSAKEYFIEVRDVNGRLLWGGFDGSGVANHAFIGANVTSVAYNFDSQPVPALEPGNIYRWQVWADLGTQSDSFVEQLISASEELRGIFRIPDDPAPVQ